MVFQKKVVLLSKERFSEGGKNIQLRSSEKQGTCHCHHQAQHFVGFGGKTATAGDSVSREAVALGDRQRMV